VASITQVSLTFAPTTPVTSTTSPRHVRERHVDVAHLRWTRLARLPQRQLAYARGLATHVEDSPT